MDLFFSPVFARGVQVGLGYLVPEFGPQFHECLSVVQQRELLLQRLNHIIFCSGKWGKFFAGQHGVLPEIYGFFICDNLV